MRAGAVVLVTGSTDGLGRATARRLAEQGATVLLHGRDPARGEAALGELREETGSDGLDLHLADLSSLAEVRELAAEVASRHDRLDVLVNNAGLGPGPRPGGRRELSADGHELRFAVNHLAPFLLTHLLLERLRAGAPARVVNVSSVGQWPIDFDDVMLNGGYDGMRAYAQSKLAQIMFSFDLAGRLPAAEVAVNALHPATLMDTKMVTQSFGRPRTRVEQGVQATVRLAASGELESVSGRYYDGLEEARAHDQAYDPEARERLWALSEELTGLRSEAGRPAASS